VFAVSTYGTISLVFWFVGLIPDLATIATAPRSLGSAEFSGCWPWDGGGSARHWHRYETAYLLLAGLATPAGALVHTVVKFRFRGQHRSRMAHDHLSALFCAGCYLLRFCDGVVPAIPIRAVYGMEDFITMRHLENSGKVMLPRG